MLLFRFAIVLFFWGGLIAGACHCHPNDQHDINAPALARTVGEEGILVSGNSLTFSGWKPGSTPGVEPALGRGK
jgi:hypothetical protein